MVKRVLAWGGGTGVAVGAGGVVGDAGPDGDLVHVVTVEGVDVECGKQGFLYPGGGLGEDSGGVGQRVEQGRVVVRWCCCRQFCERGFGAGAFGVQVGEAARIRAR
jgi:hypothetical protein